MSFGLVELITLLLSLSGFSLQHDPRAPSPDQALKYAMPDADLVVHLDAAAVIGNNYKLLLALPDQPQIRSSPELARTVRRAINEVDGLKGLIKSTSGIDLTTDVAAATLFVKVPPPGHTGPPDLVIAVRGRFATANIDRLAKLAGPAVKVGGGAMLELPPGQFPVGAVAVTRDGTLLAGATRLVKDRLADTWRAPARPAGSNLAHAASVLDARPVFAVVLAMSAAARKQVAAELGPEKNFLGDVIARHKLAALSLFHDGLGFTWIDSSRTGLDAMAQVWEGTLDMLRAAHIAPRGFAKIMLGALESYRGNPRVDALLRRKADLAKVIESYTGDGTFKVAVDKNPATLRLNVRATGKSLSDVVPAGMLVPGAMFFLVSGRSAAEPPASSIAVPPAPTPKLSPNRKAPGTRPTPAPPRPRP